jgi:hypothetical protein
MPQPATSDAAALVIPVKTNATEHSDGEHCCWRVPTVAHKSLAYVHVCANGEVGDWLLAQAQQLTMREKPADACLHRRKRPGAHHFDPVVHVSSAGVAATPLVEREAHKALGSSGRIKDPVQLPLPTTPPVEADPTTKRLVRWPLDPGVRACIGGRHLFGFGPGFVAGRFQ